MQQELHPIDGLKENRHVHLAGLQVQFQMYFLWTASDPKEAQKKNIAIPPLFTAVKMAAAALWIDLKVVESDSMATKLIGS